MGDYQRKRSRRGAKVTFGVLFGIFALFGIFYAVDFVLNKDHIPRGSTVSGVDISQLNARQAANRLEEALGKVETRPVAIRAGERESVVVPEEAGLGINWRATVEQAGKQTANPITWVRSFFTTRELDLVSDIDPARFEPALDRVVGELTAAPVDGVVVLKDGRVDVVDPIIGQDVERAEIAAALGENWLSPTGIEVAATTHEPMIAEAQVREAAEGPAKAAVESPIIARGRDNVRGEIPVQRMGEVLVFVPRDGHLHPKINQEKAQEILAENLKETEVAKRNASVRLAGGAQEVTGSVDGVKIDWEATMADFAPRVTSSDKREFDAVYIDEPATFTTEQAQSATFNDVVGEFTTGGFSAASGTNIGLTAQMVNGAFVAPGEVFSLNGHTGPRGTAQGFVSSGIILNGRADNAVGGGISQFATTLYNAAYFAGMEDVTHTPHSYYISRYPAGREATVFEGAIDLQFKNNSQHPVIIESFVSGNQVTVRLLGVKTVNVESINGGRWAYTAPQVMNVSGSGCVPTSGIQGFTTSDTRVIRSLDGAELSRETQTTVYSPQPVVRCG